MKIGIIGSGVVGRTLASGFAKHGYSPMIGTRDTARLREWADGAGHNIPIGSFSEAAEFGDILVLAVKGEHASGALRMAEPRRLIGKTIIDTTNPIDASKAPYNGVLHYFTSLERSLMEDLQSEFQDANFVKAFNSVGNALMVDPQLKEKPSMFICGNDHTSKQRVSAILQQFGWEVEDMGKAEAARVIEPLCILWCIPGFLHNQWTHAFKLLRK